MQAAKTFLSICLMVMVAAHATLSQAREKDAGAIETGVLQRLGTLPSQGYPFGASAPKEGLPGQWRNGRRAAPTSIGYLRDFFSKDFASQNRQQFSATELSLAEVFPAPYLRGFGLNAVGAAAKIAVMKLHQEGSAAVYSAAVQQDVPCANCEYKPYQMVNMLFVVSGNRISDRLLVGYVAGSTLESQSRYFFIDRAGVVHLYDVYDDEQEGSLRDEQHWRLTATGVFQKIDRKPQALVPQSGDGGARTVFSGDRAVGRVGADTLGNECEQCHTLLKVDAFGAEMQVRVPVSIVSYGSTPLFVEDFTIEEETNRSVKTLVVRSIYTPDVLRFEFAALDGGRLSAAQKTANAVHRHRIAKDDFVDVPATQLCRSEFKSGQESGFRAIDLQNFTMFRDGDCVDCPADLSLAACLQMKKAGQQFDWDGVR